MSEDVEAPPNWLRELEEKREMKVKTRLGHEAGAGSPCLECKEKCPGLDLHFWRKICKNCKCGKENHGVYDDDVSGWVQFQLLGSKPKRTHKICLLGPNELELDWTPKGPQEAVERYLKDLPPEQLPIKGSSAAHERKQLLLKQIPIHDVDPSLCHALSEEETKRMNDYVSHLKDTSVGIGQLLNFQSPITARLITSRPTLTKTKHDYENIDAFGNHKLAVSLEEIQRQQQLLESGEVIDEYGNPARAQYAMLLDKSGSPLKDPMGKPIKATLDLFGKPIFDAALVEKISPIAKAEYAMLLDKNGAPILGIEGNPIKKTIEEVPRRQLPLPLVVDKFGNEVKPHMALLLDRNSMPIKDKFGSPIMVKMDIYGHPIFEKTLSEVFSSPEHGPKFVTYLDRNGARILGPDGLPIKRAIFGKEDEPLFAIFLDSEKKVLRDKFGDPITTYLDHFRGPVFGESTMEELQGHVPSYSVLLDANGHVLQAQNFNAHREAILDKFDNQVRPQHGLLLDEHECCMKDSAGSPIKIPLDSFLRPKYDPQILEKLGNRHPEYVMFLDRNGAPILDKYGSPIKNIAYSSREPLGPPQYALLLDKNEKHLMDPNGAPLRAQIDLLGRPVDKSLQDARYSMPLDPQGATSGIQPITYLQVPRIVSSQAQGKPQWSNMLQRPDNKFLNEINGAQLASSGVPILDNGGSPVEIKIDQYGYPIMQGTNSDIQGANLLKKGLPLMDKKGQPLRVKVDRKGATIDGIPVYLEQSASVLNEMPPVVDKYGNVIDPRTGRPIDPLQNFGALSLNANRPKEDHQEPTRVNVGLINDINAKSHHLPSQGLQGSQGLKTFTPANDNQVYDIPQCHRCKQVVDDGALLIQIDRSEALWHTSCFKCRGCNQNLADLFYCYHKETDDVYCGRDYAKMRGIPRCNACDELIFVKEYCLTENMTYHIKHFCCFECDTPLAGKDYLSENNQPVCIDCYENLKADKCLGCGNIIRPHEQGANLNGEHFHATDECFACRTCRKPLLGAKFLFRNKVLFCSGVCFNASQI